MRFGAHISIAKGYEHAVKEALSIGANTMQVFSRNPRGSSAKALDPNDLRRAKEVCDERDFGPIVAHAPYVLNLASVKNETVEFGKRVLREDLERLEAANVSYLVLHPGSHQGVGVEDGVLRVSEGLKETLTGKERVMVLLEAMSGSGTELGYSFEQLRDIMDKTSSPEQYGVCFDTCHVFGAGYDIVNGLDEILYEFDRILGLDKMKVIHLNDSQFSLGSRKDRHANLGEGKLGLDTIRNIVKHPLLQDKAFILETPGDINTYSKEIEMVKHLYDLGFKE